MRRHTFRRWLVHGVVAASAALGSGLADGPPAAATPPAIILREGEITVPSPGANGVKVCPSPQPRLVMPPQATAMEKMSGGPQAAVSVPDGGQDFIVQNGKLVPAPPARADISLSVAEARPLPPGPAAISAPLVPPVPPAPNSVRPSATSAVAPIPTASISLRPDLAATATTGADRTFFPRGEPAPRRRAYIDLSAAPCFARAADYSWIIGQVEYSSVTKQWRLRYASVDEPDRFGGRVILIETQHVQFLADGMYIHARGRLVNSGNGDAHYRIESFQTIENPNVAAMPSERQ